MEAQTETPTLCLIGLLAESRQDTGQRAAGSDRELSISSFDAQPASQPSPAVNRALPQASQLLSPQPSCHLYRRMAGWAQPPDFCIAAPSQMQVDFYEVPGRTLPIT